MENHILSIENQTKKRIFKKYFILFFVFILYIFSHELKNTNTTQLFDSISNRLIKDEFFKKENEKCDILDPIYIMSQRFQKNPNIICKSETSEHLCYRSSIYDYYNKLYRFPYGIICTIKNFILDPSKSFQSNLKYKGPIDDINRGSAILSNGFFKINCKLKSNFKTFSKLYKNYIDSWEYQDENEKFSNLEELAPGKTIFLISRNQDSPNLFHGISELINALCIIYLFNLKPEDIQIVFLESMILENEPLYELYTRIISRGSKPLYLRDLNKRYFISSAINIPVAGDSPLFMFIKGHDCKYSIKTYKILNKLINKYLNISIFHDSFISDNKTYYYPELTIRNHKLNKKFSKIITFQWRKVWPEGRTKQKRILGNGPELAEMLANNLPNDFLIRLIDTASLSIIDQISLMKNTDYFIGVHGAGLSLSIFMPNNSILFEITPYKKNKLLLLMSKLSGHKTYSEIIKSKTLFINKNEYIFFEGSNFIESVLKNMKYNKFIK